jgi:hypothetical protein
LLWLGFWGGVGNAAVDRSIEEIVSVYKNLAEDNKIS